MKLWLLSPHQAVFHSYHRVSFCTKGRHDDLVLRIEQFWKLHDIMKRLRRGHHHLGRGLYLKMTGRGVCVLKIDECAFIFKAKVGSVIKGVFIGK